jgi:galactose mutarotase-like enzyme
MTDIVTIRSGQLSAEINPVGAELHALRDGDGRDLLWDGDPAVWSGRAPVLFPVIGVVNGGVIHVDGHAYPMAKHGFARRRTWAVVEQGRDAVTFRLEDDAETRASYPFAFRLDLRFVLVGPSLSLTATLTNPNDRPLPASFGFHPALRWPLPYGGERAAHAIRFDDPEPQSIRRIDGDGLLRPAPEPTPVDGRDLLLRDDLFTDDAVIFDAHHSRGLSYCAPATPGLRVDFPDMPELGIWTKPGAGYICIEPWAGIADPEGFVGDLTEKPGITMTPPGQSRLFTMRIALEGH